MIKPKQVLMESIPVMTIAAGISVFSGLFLSRNEELLRYLPGILIVLPLLARTPSIIMPFGKIEIRRNGSWHEQNGFQKGFQVRHIIQIHFKTHPI